MPEREIVCPSGLAGRVRGLKGKEFKLLGDKKAVRSGEAFDKIKRACWIETSDVGPYSFEEPRWNDVLVCDRFYVLIAIRLATYPDEEYPFKVYCENDKCQAPIDWEVPLDELPVKMLPKESRENFKNGNKFPTTLGGKEIMFKLGTGKDCP